MGGDIEIVGFSNKETLGVQCADFIKLFRNCARACYESISKKLTNVTFDDKTKSMIIPQSYQDTEMKFMRENSGLMHASSKDEDAIQFFHAVGRVYSWNQEGKLMFVVEPRKLLKRIVDPFFLWKTQNPGIFPRSDLPKILEGRDEGFEYLFGHFSVTKENTLYIPSLFVPSSLPGVLRDPLSVLVEFESYLPDGLRLRIFSAVLGLEQVKVHRQSHFSRRLIGLDYESNQDKFKIEIAATSRSIEIRVLGDKRDVHCHFSSWVDFARIAWNLKLL